MKNLKQTALLVFSVSVLSGAAFSSALFSLPANAEQRQPVELNTQQRDWVIEYMRLMLEATADIQGLLADGKAELLAQRINQLNQDSALTKPRAIGQSFPDGFRFMAHQMQTDWQLLADSQSSEQALQNSRTLLNQCNACHRSFYLAPAKD